MAILRLWQARDLNHLTLMLPTHRAMSLEASVEVDALAVLRQEILESHRHLQDTLASGMSRLGGRIDTLARQSVSNAAKQEPSKAPPIPAAHVVVPSFLPVPSSPLPSSPLGFATTAPPAPTAAAPGNVATALPLPSFDALLGPVSSDDSVA